MKRRAPLSVWLELLIAHYRKPDETTTHSVDVMVGACHGNQRQFICLNASTMGIGISVFPDHLTLRAVNQDVRVFDEHDVPVDRELDATPSSMATLSPGRPA